MKTYHDIEGDGGSNVLAQVEAQQGAIAAALDGVRHVVAIGSGKGGVGKSTVTMALARALRRSHHRVAILDGDFNGPCQAQLAGLGEVPWIPGDHGLRVPRDRHGIGVISFGSVFPAAQPVDFDSVATGGQQTWRGTREFATLGQLLGGVDWGELDVLLFDLPPGSERTVQFADFLGERASFILVTIPSDLSRGVVARSIAALDSSAAPLLGYVENMAGYYCRECDDVKPLFPPSATELSVPCLGTLPFDPQLARLGREPSAESDSGPAWRGVEEIAAKILKTLESP